MRLQVPGPGNDAGLCCKAFKLSTLQAILILAARQWGFLLGGQVVHQGIQQSEAGHHTVAVDLYKKLTSQREARSDLEALAESPVVVCSTVHVSGTTDAKLKYLNPDC